MIDLPQAPFDHPYPGTLIEIVGNQAVAQACPPLALACSIRLPFDTCVVVLPAPVSARTAALLRRHELGHCNGWPADHPDYLVARRP